MAINKRLTGWIAKKNGAKFENICEYAASTQGFITLPIEDGVKKTGPNGSRLISVPNLFDLILVATHKQVVIFTDCKSKDLEYLTPSNFLTRDTHRIQKRKSSTERQLETMARLARFGYMAGFTVLLRPLSRVVWVCALDILNTPKGKRIPMRFISNGIEPNFTLLLDGSFKMPKSAPDSQSH